MTKKFWAIRPGRRGEIANAVHKQNVVAIGWKEVGDLHDYASKDEIKTCLKQVSPNKSNQTIGKNASQIFRFAYEISKGDICFVPVAPKKKVWVAKISGDYQYNPQTISKDFPNIRKVEWLREILYTEMSPELIKAMEAPPTVYGLRKYDVELTRLLSPTTPPEPVTSLPQGKLSQIHLDNFKAFSANADVDISPITVVAGVNSSGKTTIVQSLLLARQTLITPYQTRSAIEDAIVYQGSLIRFGDFREMVFGNPPQGGSFHLSFTIQLYIEPEHLQVYFGDYSGYVNVKLDAEFTYHKVRKNVIVRQVKLSAFTSGQQQVSETANRFDLTIKSAGDKWRIKWNGQKFFSERLLTMNRFIPTWEIPGHWPDETSDRGAAYAAFRSILAPALEILREELTEKLYYVGPLRSGPQRPYLPRNVRGLNIGDDGIGAVQLLHEKWDADVDFVILPDDLEELNKHEIRTESMKLHQAVHNALRLIGMSQRLNIRKRGESYEAELSLHARPEKYVSIMDVGFGVSQILPIITIGLVSPTDSILVFEQPEIHLHPKAQAGLADFLLCLARTGRRIILETHSDHLINRLRRRIVEAEKNSLENYVGIIFVSPPEQENGGAIISKTKIDHLGDPVNWPPGFLADGAEDIRALMLARSAKRQQYRKEQGG